MTTLSDARFESLRAQGFTGATSDMLLQWLQANTPTGPVGFPATYTIFNNAGALRGYRAPEDPTSPPDFGDYSPRSVAGKNLTRFTVNPGNDLVVLGTTPRGQLNGQGTVSVLIPAFSGTPFVLTWDVTNSDYRGNPAGFGAWADANQAPTACTITVDGLTAQESDTVPDAWRAMLDAQGFDTGHRNDDWYALLGSLGYEGALPDRELGFWESGGNLGPPSPSLPAWAAASSEYMLTGSGSHEFEAQRIGTGTPTFTTPAGLLLPDHEGVYREIPEDTMPVHGARLVRNHAVVTEDFTDVAWSKQGSVIVTGDYGTAPDGTSSADRLEIPASVASLFDTSTLFGYGDFIWSLYIRATSGTASVRLSLFDGSTTYYSADLSLTETWKRYSVAANITSGSSIIWSVERESGGGAADILIWGAQLEIVSGASDTTKPGEYVANPTNSFFTPAQKFYSNLNGNTVTNNVVTEAVGAALDPAPSLYAAPAMTNLVLWSRNLSAVGNGGWWTPSTYTTSYDQPGLTEEPNTATLIESTDATLGNFVRGQNMTLNSGVNTLRAIVKASTNSSRLMLTLRNFSSTPECVLNFADGTVSGNALFDAIEANSIGNGWYEMLAEVTASSDLTGAIWFATRDTYSTNVAGLNAIIGNAECYAGKSIDQVRGSAPIVTSGTSATNTLITRTYDSANHSDTEGAYFLSAKTQQAANILNGFLSVTGSNFQVSDGTNTSTRPWTANTLSKIGIAYGDSKLAINVDGTWGTEVAYDGTLLSGILDAFRTTDNPGQSSNEQRWALGYDDARSKVEELML